MNDTQLLDASCRVALAGMLHDLGKFAERARIPEAEQKDADGVKRRDVNVQLICPHFDGRPTHIHAAYTAIALDLIERYFPDLVGEDMTPFAPWKDKDADDSLINAAAKHHRPQTFLQWVIATADRVASGFEREEFERYNAAPDETEAKKNHYTARQLTLLEQIRLTESATAAFSWRYRLAPLSPLGLFPVEALSYEHDDTAKAQQEYHALWEQFVQGLQQVPPAHRKNLALWLDHFDSLWQCFAHAIPAATAFGTKPEVSLYDHSKTVAALAVAIWRYHHERGDDPETARRAMSQYSDWGEEKFLLVQGDFSGIQDFIFATGGETQRRAAKLLRGRSFYVALLAECAALRVLDALALPPTSQVINAAGKFLIVAPNTQASKKALTQVQRMLDAWFLEHSFGQAGIQLACLPAACDDFRYGQGQEDSPFRLLMRRLFEQLEEAKLQRYGLCGAEAPESVFDGFLDRFDNQKGVCAIDGRSPATEELSRDEAGNSIWVSPLARDQIDVGGYLASFKRILITRQSLNHHTLRLPVFGYFVNFTAEEDISGRFGREAETGNLLRAWDFSLPEDERAPLWNGYARRAINAYVPRFGALSSYDRERYQGLDEPESPHEIKTLEHLARDDWRFEDDRWVGVEALMTLKGDVDNLGQIFQRGLERPTFAKMAALSRQMNAFFTIWLPWLCHKEFPNTYTVFAGGDDFFLIGPWHSTIQLARRMEQEFRRYACHNPEVHFSAGLSMTKSGLPVRYLARLAEEALDEAKAGKPAVTCFGQAVKWEDFEALLKRHERLAELVRDFGLSSGYVYDLLRYCEMAAEMSKRPENALWRAHFAYRTYRLLEAKVKGPDFEAVKAKRKRLHEELAQEIAEDGIERYRLAYKIPLFVHLYQQRD